MADHLTPAEAAKLLNMSVSWLEKQRRLDRRGRPAGVGPPWHQIPGTNRLFYIRAELVRWMRGRGEPKAKHDGASHGLTWAEVVELQPLAIEQESPE